MNRGFLRRTCVWALACACVVGADVEAREAPKLTPATPTGAREAVAHYAEALIRPEFQAEGRARATCGRYLETARRTLAAETSEKVCSVTLRALKAHAMCHWLAGKDDDAKAVVDELVTTRCSGGREGLSDAMWLAERWWRPSFVRRVIARQRKGTKSRAERLSLLDELERRGNAVRQALGKDHPRRGGGLLVDKVPAGSPASRAGLRSGDVIISVAARPVRQPKDIARHLESRTRATTSVLYYRAGERIEGAWPGKRLGKLQALPLPERLP